MLRLTKANLFAFKYEWLHLKYDKLAAQVFEDKYKVDLALMTAIEAREQQWHYSVECFKFNRL